MDAVCGIADRAARASSLGGLRATSTSTSGDDADPSWVSHQAPMTKIKIDESIKPPRLCGRRGSVAAVDLEFSDAVRLVNHLGNLAAVQNEFHEAVEEFGGGNRNNSANRVLSIGSDTLHAFAVAIIGVRPSTTINS